MISFLKQQNKALDLMSWKSDFYYISQKYPGLLVWLQIGTQWVL